MIIKFKKRTRGFGIVEVLISGVIIIIVLGALVVLARNAINNSQYVQERAQAVNLAQEGMEVVRQMRDSNYIDKNSYATTSWRTMVTGNPTKDFAYNTYYYIGFNSNPVAMRFRLVKAAAPAISLGGNNFYRTVYFTDIKSSNILKFPKDVSNTTGANAVADGVVVKVTVKWPDNSATAHSVEIEELLTNSRFQF